MKKSLLALAVLGAFSGLAAAQSTVTLFGIVDLNAKWVKNDGFGNRKSMSQDGLQSSRLGFRGIEDLGGGLKAGFHIEGAMQPDVGTSGGQQWARKSTLSLLGGFGEVRLGRDYTPGFVNHTTFDPFGTNGVGSVTNVARYANGNGPGAVIQSTFTRSSNSIGYFLPSNIGGVYGQAMVAAGEGAAGKYFGGRVGFAGGPVNVALAASKQDTNVAGTLEYKTISLGASFNFGFATLLAQISQETNELAAPTAEQKERRAMIGANVPLGQGELRASFTRSDASGGAAGFSSNDANQMAVGYVYNLSKRTALYTTVARIDNKGAQNFNLGGTTTTVAPAASGVNSSNPGGPTAGGKSTAAEAGIRHSF